MYLIEWVIGDKRIIPLLIKDLSGILGVFGPKR